MENFNNSKTINGVSYNLNDVRVGSLSLEGTIYEAEKATITNAQAGTAVDASNGQEVQYINESDSSVDFQNIKVSQSGNYSILIRYSNGEGTEASHTVTVNGTQIGTVNYPVTVNWDRYLWSSFTCYLNEGVNSIKFTKNVGFAELDCIQVSSTEQSFVDGAAVGQWGATGYGCQEWTLVKEGVN